MSRLLRNQLGTIGVISNPAAGKGGHFLGETLKTLFGCLRGVEVTVGEGTIEAAEARRSGVDGRLLSENSGQGNRAGDLAGRLVDAGVETIVGIGGDGTLRDIAEVLVERGGRVRLFGVGVGSSNVGPLVSATPENLERILWGMLCETKVHAVAADDGARAVLAFNDVTFGNTYFGTRDGRRMDLDAAASLRGEDRSAVPRSVCGPATWVAKNGRRLLDGRQIGDGQIVVSPLNHVEACAGKAISGFLCWGPYVGCHGLLAAASTVMIRTQVARADLVEAEPLRLHHVGFAPEDVVEVGGFLPEAVMVVDGNPVGGVDPDVPVSLRVLDGALTTLRAASGNPGSVSLS